MSQPSPGQRLFSGGLALAVGLGIMSVGAGFFPAALDGLHAPLWVLFSAGAVFALAGVSLLSAGRLPAWVPALCGNLILSLFVAILGSIALGGSRAGFSSSLDFAGAWLQIDTIGIGRIVFGGVGVLLALVAAGAWLALLRKLGWGGRAALLFGAATLGYLLLVVAPAEPRWPDVADDHQRLARYALLVEDEGWARIRKREPIRWYYPPWRDFEGWTQAARSRLAAARVAPAGQTVLHIPVMPSLPVIDGRIGADEWRGALELTLAPEALGTRVSIRSDGRTIFLAADVPADTTASGYDQFRFWFHIRLSPWLDNERVFVDRSGGVASLRATRFPWGKHAPRHRTDWRIYERARGAASLDGHRRFELAVDLGEAGIAAGVPFPAWFEVEGDPLLDAQGKFKARTDLGHAGNHDAPLWLVVAATIDTSAPPR